MTDCATLLEHRGKGLLSQQFIHLEKQMERQGVHTLFSFIELTDQKAHGLNRGMKVRIFYGGISVKAFPLEQIVGIINIQTPVLYRV
jgi:hypothetical protein